MYELLAWLLRRFRPREGWAALLLTLAAALSLPAILLEDSDALSPGPLLTITLLAALTGLRLSRTRLTAQWAGVIGAALGLAVTLIAVGRMLPPLDLPGRDASHLIAWLRRGRPPFTPPPPSLTLGFFRQRAYDLALRLWWWGQTAAGGATAQDPIAWQIIAAWGCWALTFFAVWQLYRRRRPLVGLIPLGLAVATAAFFHGGAASFYLLLFLFSGLWLTALGDLWAQQDRWEADGTDYPGQLGQELVIALAPWLLALLALAAFFPVIHPNQVREAFWRTMSGPWSRVERAAERVFGPLEGGYPGPGGTADGQLPQAHLLGGGPELAETVVLYVVTGDPPPDDRAAPETPRRYWRSLTYDTYTGRGWQNGPLEVAPLPPGGMLDPAAPPGPRLLQQFELLTGGEGEQPLPLVNAPLQVNQTVTLYRRGEGDLAQVAGRARRYTALSRPPQPTIAELQAAPSDLPPGPAERYLALPPGIPRRVSDLARQVVAGAETRYDQAHALERFLRTYPYTLDLPPPPSNRDVVDYFLYDLQEGYCDYYASAMVVMARSVGIPARLASGYAQGTFDAERGRWVVTEKDGHSWVEVYFAGIGWVEFEPTAGLPALTRPGGAPEEETAPPPKPPRAGGRWSARRGLLSATALLAGGVIAVGLWRLRRHANLPPEALLRDRQRRLLHWGARLGRPLRDGQTLNEYTRALGDALRRRGAASRWSAVRRAGETAPAEVRELGQVLTQARYRPRPPDGQDAARVRSLWAQLRRRLWPLWLGGKKEKPPPGSSKP